MNAFDEVGEGPDETACIRMQSRLHGEVLVGFLVSRSRVFLSPGRGRTCRPAGSVSRRQPGSGDVMLMALHGESLLFFVQAAQVGVDVELEGSPRGGDFWLSILL